VGNTVGGSLFIFGLATISYCKPTKLGSRSDQEFDKELHMARPTISPGLRIYDPVLYEHLLAAAAKNGRTLNKELTFRLVKSVEAELKNQRKREAAA
jgi:hypothetical protein